MSSEIGTETEELVEELTTDNYEPNYDQMAQEFLRGKLEGLFAKAHKTPNPKSGTQMKDRIRDYDPTIFSGRKFITPKITAPPQLDLKKGFLF